MQNLKIKPKSNQLKQGEVKKWRGSKTKIKTAKKWGGGGGVKSKNNNRNEKAKNNERKKK